MTTILAPVGTAGSQGTHFPSLSLSFFICNMACCETFEKQSVSSVSDTRMVTLIIITPHLGVYSARRPVAPAGPSPGWLLTVSSPQIARLEQTWMTLRQRHTEGAILYEKKLKPFLKSLNEGTGTSPTLLCDLAQVPTLSGAAKTSPVWMMMRA